MRCMCVSIYVYVYLYACMHVCVCVCVCDESVSMYEMLFSLRPPSEAFPQPIYGS